MAINKFHLNNRAFSLIELMSVVAIVAILSVIGISAYKQYMISARLFQVQSLVGTLVNNAVLYANENGVFPTAGQLGLTTHTASTALLTASTINPYLRNLWANDQDRQTGGTACGRAGYISGSISADGAGLSNVGSDAMYFSCIMANINSQIQTKCFYSYPTRASSGNYSLSYGNGVNNSAGLNNLMLGWTHDNTGENDHDYTNFTNYISYVEANSACIH